MMPQIRRNCRGLTLLWLVVFFFEYSSEESLTDPSKVAVVTTVCGELHAVGAQALIRSLRTVGGLRTETQCIAIVPSERPQPKAVTQRLASSGWQILHKTVPKPKVSTGKNVIVRERREWCQSPELHVWKRDAIHVCIAYHCIHTLCGGYHAM
jgi:hypothetical protein